MNLTIDFAKIYTTPQEIAQIIWQNAILSYELNYLISMEIDDIKMRPKPLSIDDIITIVCKHFNMKERLIQMNTRKREIVQCRQIIMYFCKLKTKESLETIGSLLGDRDHATVLYAVKTVNNLCETDAKFKNQIRQLDKLIK